MCVGAWVVDNGVDFIIGLKLSNGAHYFAVPSEVLAPWRACYTPGAGNGDQCLNTLGLVPSKNNGRPAVN